MLATLAGYASVFETPDLGRDIIARGAFAKSLRARKAQKVRMLYQHDATRPIGVWHKIYETEKGLWVEGTLALGASTSRDAQALLEAGALDGLSIGYRTQRAQATTQGRRRLLEVELLEISLVTFPMQPYARVMRIGRLSGTGQASPAYRPVTPQTLRKDVV